MNKRDIAVYFHSPPDAVHGMIQKLENKGRLRQVAVTCDKDCSGCSCGSMANDIQSEIWAVVERV